MTLTLPSPVRQLELDGPAHALTIVAAVINTDATIKAGVAIPNTATFTSTTGPTGGTTPTPVKAERDGQHRRAAAGAGQVRQRPPANGVSGGDTVTFTLQASNAAGSSLLHAGWVIDCLPSGLTFVAYGTPSVGSTLPAEPSTGTGPGGDGCASGTTQLAWNVGDVAPGAAAATLTYTATVEPNAPGKETFTNTAALTGDSLAGARAGPTDPGNAAGRLSTAGATSQVTVAGRG